MKYLLLLLISASAHAGVYRCGNTYTDTPCGVEVKVIDNSVAAIPTSVPSVSSGPSVSSSSTKDNALCGEIKQRIQHHTDLLNYFRMEQNKAWERMQIKRAEDEYFSKCFGKY